MVHHRVHDAGPSAQAKNFDHTFFIALLPYGAAEGDSGERKSPAGYWWGNLSRAQRSSAVKLVMLTATAGAMRAMMSVPPHAACPCGDCRKAANDLSVMLAATSSP
jgi:hypothetical protein